MTTSLPYTTDSDGIHAHERHEETATTLSKIAEHGGIRVRIIEHSTDDNKQPFTINGLIAYCLEGEITSIGADGRSITISKGMLFVLPEIKILYKVNSLSGAKLLVIDRPLNRKKTEPNPWRM